MAERLPGGDNPPYPVDPEEHRIAPDVMAGQYVYMMQDGSVNISSNLQNDLMYTADTVGIATQNIYNVDIRDRTIIRGYLDLIKDRGTVFQDQFELNQTYMVSDPVDPQATVAITHAGNPQPELDSVQPLTQRIGQLYGVIPPDTHTHTSENTELARAIELLKAQDDDLVQRLKTQARKDEKGQFQVCYGCVLNVESVFPGKFSNRTESCIICTRRSGNKHDQDYYMTKDTRSILFELFAKEVIPNIKKQALLEAKQRISEAEEKDNNVKRKVARIVKKR